MSGDQKDRRQALKERAEALGYTLAGQDYGNGAGDWYLTSPDDPTPEGSPFAHLDQVAEYLANREG